MRELRHVAIIGGGFSGVALVAELIRRRKGLAVTLVESAERLGRGVAYGTAVGSHLLNTRASQMSLYADDPDHFVRWSRRRGHAVHGTEFLPRCEYGEYLEESLRELCAAAAPTGLTVHLQAQAADVVPNGERFTVRLVDRRTLIADAVVIATGHPSPADPFRGDLPDHSCRYLRDPWRCDAYASIAPSDRVLIVGTGLTAVDTVLALEQGGHRGPIHALSRHGLLPRAHRADRPALPPDLRTELFVGLSHDDLRRAIATVRRVAACADERGVGWQAVIDALRPAVPRLWTALCPSHRRRFVQSLQPYWDVHRHRLPPSQASRVAELQAGGRLKVMAGRLRSGVDEGKSIVAEYTLRASGELVRERYDWVINCTGSSFTKGVTRPLERRLLERGLLLADPLGLGYVATDIGAVIGAGGPLAGLYLLSPACRANFWEHTAVPELRAQAAALADDLLRVPASAWVAAVKRKPAAAVAAVAH